MPDDVGVSAVAVVARLEAELGRLMGVVTRQALLIEALQARLAPKPEDHPPDG